ncbi:MAG: acetylglutamate kinase [Clostridiales bacterium]|jgi:acetylglutamate kinase|nr:acetylglutamate kinase [Clostridiales bacterium]
MDYTNGQRAEILIQALPYIKSYTNKIIVVKYGGNAMLNDEMKRSVMCDIVLLSLVGIKVVLIHGGGPEISDLLEKVGKQSKFVNGLRVTDAETAEYVQMALAGKVNKTLVNKIGSVGGKAMGLSGIDGHMITAKRRDEALGFVGDIIKINSSPITDILDKGYIPVISTVACDAAGNTYNINADTAASRIAGELGAETMINMTDIAGILRDVSDPSTLIPTIAIDEIPSLIDSGIISGGMIPKVRCCAEAVECGVKKVFIIDGRIPHSIIIEVLTDEGMGTMFVKQR